MPASERLAPEGEAHPLGGQGMVKPSPCAAEWVGVRRVRQGAVALASIAFAAQNLPVSRVRRCHPGLCERNDLVSFGRVLRPVCGFVVKLYAAGWAMCDTLGLGGSDDYPAHPLVGGCCAARCWLALVHCLPFCRAGGAPGLVEDEVHH